MASFPTNHGAKGVWEPTIAPRAAVDWVAKGAVSPVKDQGQCGSCWAFSAVGSIEGAHQIAGNPLTQFSEQQLVSCSTSYGNLGCNGGLMDSAFQYVEKNGLCTETDYPYTAKSDFLHCRASSCATAVKITGYTDVKSLDESALLAAATAAPVSVAIEADTQVFQLYSGGVFDNARCGTQLDHGVLVVGYGTDTKDYWKVKNSWGSSWGESGYIRMVRGKNMCGINTQPSFPTGASLLN
jgi:C1A family cysteine protease